MWHEARKQEKKIRGLLVDYQRRAQRRKDYYEKIKADPTQFLQLHGRQCKIHIDPGIAIAANSPATMMPWQGNDEIMIDRFDARAHLDFIREVINDDSEEELSNEERLLNYERYRILVQNEFLAMPESKFLHQLFLEEKFGPVGKPDTDDNKKKSAANAAIPYKYNNEEDTTTIDDSKKYLDIKTKTESSDESDEESEMDFDLSIDITKISTDQANELNSTAHNFGMTTNDFYSFLNNDIEEAENIQLTRLAEEEKAMFAGRRSRRERRAFRLKALEGKALSPLSYATRKSPSYTDFEQLSSMITSRSPTPENTGQVTYITSFGDEEQALTSDKSKTSKSKSTSKHSSSRRKCSRTRSPRRRSRSPIKNHSREHRSQSKNKSVSPPREPKPQSPPAQKPPPVQRYYGRRGKDSSSELSLSEDETKKDKKNTSKIITPLRDPSLASFSKKLSQSDKKPTPQEIMKRKMKVLLNKQYKADKKAQRERELKMEREQIEREEEIKELSLKIRRRRRQLRHPDNSSPLTSSSSSSSRSTSRSKSRSSISSSSSSSYSRYRKRRCRTRSRSIVRHRSKSTDRRRRSRSDDRRRPKRSEERERYRRDDRRDYDRRDDYRSRHSPERRDRRGDRRDSPVRREIKPRESPDRRKKEIVDNRPVAKITYEASPKRYIPSTKTQTNSQSKPLVDY
ncbi:CLK4-associating serine/arginine rich protein-like [Adelges cooleyi]|uniref:CLK4-associating serine/arginine rich protein-like n=1 Tax=Adelges cooleyi TaxID=133065 RepID=UPI0021808957|nr:CLK4-associating serine/arginine rich protein-like [Adelges cooleyi]